MKDRLPVFHFAGKTVDSLKELWYTARVVPEKACRHIGEYKRRKFPE